MALLCSPTIVNELSVLIFGIAHVILLGFFLCVASLSPYINVIQLTLIPFVVWASMFTFFNVPNAIYNKRCILCSAAAITRDEGERW